MAEADVRRRRLQSGDSASRKRAELLNAHPRRGPHGHDRPIGAFATRRHGPLFVDRALQVRRGGASTPDGEEEVMPEDYEDDQQDRSQEQTATMPPPQRTQLPPQFSPFTQADALELQKMQQGLASNTAALNDGDIDQQTHAAMENMLNQRILPLAQKQQQHQQ